MQRRTFLLATSATVAGALAGCTSDLDGDPGGAADGGATTTDEASAEGNGGDPDESDGGDPTTTAEDPDEALAEPVDAIVKGFNDDDVSAVEAALHPDGPARESLDDAEVEGMDLEREDLEVVERGDEEATVRTELTFHSDDGTDRAETRFELRTDDGEWTVWGIETNPDGETTTARAVPQATFEFEYDASATDGDDTGVLTVTHYGGDHVPAENLVIRGHGIVDPAGADPDVTESDTDAAAVLDDDQVVAGTTLTVGVESSYDVMVVYQGEDDSAVLAQDDR